MPPAKAGATIAARSAIWLERGDPSLITKVLALDFDGVISDSAPEVFLVALRAYEALHPGAPYRALLRECGPGIEAILGSPVYRQFVEMMPLGNRAEDFGVELAALAEGRVLRDQAEYDVYFARQSPGFLEDFHQLFYRERRDFQQAEPERWDDLVRPYPGFMAALHELSGRLDLTIATAKDRTSVDRCLKRYGVESLFPKDRIFDKETGRDKRRHLEAIAGRCGVAFEEIRFVDDKVNHLINVAGLGVDCVLAGWGYNGPRERKLATLQGFTVCALDQAVAILGA